MKKLAFVIAIDCIFIAFCVNASQLHLRMNPLTCPEGQILRPKPGFIPISNGCGESDWQVLLGELINPYSQDFLQCCINHDSCYQKCDVSGFPTNSFQQCNKQFGECLQDSCQQVEDGFGCTLFATAYDSMVKEFGKSAFKGDQRQSCICQ